MAIEHVTAGAAFIHIVDPAAAEFPACALTVIARKAWRWLLHRLIYAALRHDRLSKPLRFALAARGESRQHASIQGAVPDCTGLGLLLAGQSQRHRCSMPCEGGRGA